MSSNRVNRVNTGDVNLERIQDASRDSIESIDTDRPFGVPTEEQYSNYQSSFGEIVLVNPVNGTLIVGLPACTKADAGKLVTVKNYSAIAGTNIYVKPAAADGTVDKLASIYISLAYEVRTFAVVSENKWVQVSL